MAGGAAESAPAGQPFWDRLTHSRTRWHQPFVERRWRAGHLLAEPVFKAAGPSTDAPRVMKNKTAHRPSAPSRVESMESGLPGGAVPSCVRARRSGTAFKQLLRARSAAAAADGAMATQAVCGQVGNDEERPNVL